QRLSRRVPVLRLPTADLPPTRHTPPEVPILSTRETKTEINPVALGHTAPMARTQPAPPQPFVAKPTPITGSFGNMVPGYQFTECVGRGAAGESWLAESRTGESSLVKIVAGFNPEISCHQGGPLH